MTLTDIISVPGRHVENEQIRSEKQSTRKVKNVGSESDDSFKDAKMWKKLFHDNLRFTCANDDERVLTSKWRMRGDMMERLNFLTTKMTLEP